MYVYMCDHELCMLNAKKFFLVIGLVIDLLLKQDCEKPCNYYLNI